MSKIRNVSGQDRVVPSLGNRRVFAGQVVDVPLEGQYGVCAFTQMETTWAPADEEAQGVHDAMLAGIAQLLGIDVAIEATAVEIIKAVAEMDADQVAALVEAETARAKPRTTVLAAAEKRLSEITTHEPGDLPGNDKPLEG